MIGWRGKSGSSGPPLIDHGYLERLAGHLGHEVMQELLADGMLELSDRLTRIEELALKGDREALAALTHDIVGAAGHLGLSAMSSHAAEANRALQDQRGSNLMACVRDMLDCRDASVNALGRFCRENVVRAAEPPGR